MLYWRLVHVGDAFNRFANFWTVNCTKMCMAADLRADPLGSYSAPPDPLAVIRGRGERERGEKGWEQEREEGEGRT